ncbi:HdeD family acid-resistance protein [Algoriphagus marinus]|uniref:HdeD family acid-resistance protein n=1 Tax=Algoriphagus marinus TaxID=1925762 RepID=UPI00094BBB17|nr:HdeD family acid-resistance protein [Algoriphagus marinus]
MEQPLKSIRKVINHWYLVTIIGVIFILLGIWVFRTPLASYLILATIFSVSFLIAGIAEIAFALGNRKQLDHWGWFFGSGILSTLIGMLLISNPGLSMVTLPLYIGFGVMFRSISAISFAFNLKEIGSEYHSILYMGLVGMVLSFLLIWNPTVVGMTLVTMTALIFILLGMIAIMLSLKMKKFHDFPGKLKDRIAAEQ